MNSKSLSLVCLEVRVIELAVLKRRILDSVGIDPYENSLRGQFIFYLSQAFGIQFGYVFGHRLYGPYSKSAERSMSEYLRYSEQADLVAKETEISSENEERVKSLTNFLEEISRPGSNFDNYLEALVDLHFLAVFSLETVQKELVIKTLRRERPKFKEKSRLLTKAWNLLEDYELIKRKPTD